MKRFHISLSVSLMMAMLMTATAEAQQRANPLGQYFKTIDKDGDGKIAKHEAPARMKEHFDRLDTDGDGFATLEELQAMFANRRGQAGQDRQPASPGERPAGQMQRPGGPGQGQRPGGQGQALQAATERIFKLMDPNDDGKIEKDEAPAKMKEHFDTIDTDKDGTVTPDEMKVFIAGRMQAAGQQNPLPGGQRPTGPGQGMQGQRPGGQGPNGPGPGMQGQRPGGQGQGGTASRMVKMMLNNMDKDKDGMLSKEEVRGPLKANFDKVDTDSDGYLSIDELEKSIAPQPRQWGGGQGPNPGGQFQRPGGPQGLGQNQGGQWQRPGTQGLPPITPEAMIEHMDKNNDGKLSKEEIQGPLQDRFNEVDTNNDGYLTIDELKNSIAELMKRMGGGQGQRPGGLQYQQRQGSGPGGAGGGQGGPGGNRQGGFGGGQGGPGGNRQSGFGGGFGGQR